MILENRTFSFVQMQVATTEVCDGANYPVVAGTDINFQFVVEAEDSTELSFLLSSHPVRLVLYDGSILQATQAWIYKDLGANRVLISLPAGNSVVDSLADNTCFRFRYITDGADITQGYDSTCFIKKASAKDTTLLKYSSPTDQNGFIYCDAPAGFENSIRLPMIISDVSFEGTDNIYRFSNGRQYNAAGFRNKVLHFKTDLLEISALDYLTAALMSRSVTVENEKYAGEIVPTGAIEADFDEDNIAIKDYPTATFTAYQTPYDVALNPCINC